ncbi:class II aldolase/adducin family protein [Methylomonas albis]|uniref:Class II aldolase/adducin family protein n=1 Tax=Methylomonas albis TaxID=1854563 RepID=A0ABR9D080_9GAMM|nr:class II aldolase/adducin family protein [Methylomonas albis]MBD9356538.1 class II aldolase/adducin family protein [Methylomonas albis]CAD6879654.1 class II aldolase/adducin family protein [Methylomonas albis]
MENRFSELEGVIKYRLDHQHAELAADIDISELNAWRSLFYRLRLIGQITEKYAGLGFGNISRRLVPGGQEFLISGTQTGHLPVLNKQHFALIETASQERNAIKSRGASQPSSEALTHASVYRQHSLIAAVIHVHCPELWLQTTKLNLACTAMEVPYGTPEMANAVAKLFESGRLQQAGLFSMLGHEDGIVAFGATLTEAACLLIEQLAKAIAIEQSQLWP